MSRNRDLFTKFEAFLLTEKLVSANTFSAYKHDIAQFEQFLIKEQLTLEQVTVKDLKVFLKFLKDLDIGARSVSRKISSLKVLFAFLTDKFGIENKAEDLHFPKFKKGLPVFLSEHEVELLLKAAEKDTSALGVRNKIMLYLLYVSGMRISELTSLKLSALQFDTGFIRVKGKGGRERMIPIPQPMMDLLRQYIEEIHSQFTNKGRSTDYLFPILYSGKIKSITRQSFWLILNNLWRQTGIKKVISPHKLRHSLATHMLKNGADLRALQLILGHENLATVQIYTHVETSQLRKIYDEKHPRSE